MGDEPGCWKRVSDYVPARLVMALMAFLGFVVTQMLRSSLYIAMVAMVRPDNNSTISQNSYGQRVSWDVGDQGLVLSALYWSYWLSELPGGMMAQRLGPRRVLAVATFAAGLLALALPYACTASVTAAVTVRALQGLALGVTWPAMHCLSGRWIPATERSKFMSTYHGAAVGNALTFPLSGWLISILGWESVFYVSGGLSILWSIIWLLLVYDSPEKHPRLSGRESRYLARALGSSPAAKSRGRTPWGQILRSIPCWAVCLTSLGLMWGRITLTMQLPAYLTRVHKLDIKTNGLLSGLPDLCKFGFSFFISALLDALVKKGRFSLTVARKVAVATSALVPASMLAMVALSGGDTTRVAVLLVLSSSAGGASSAGSLANIVDLSPKFAGVILGLIKTLSMIPGVLSPLVAAALTSDQSGDEEILKQGWSKIFLLTSAVYAACCLVFLALGTAKVQSWDTPEIHHLATGSVSQVLPVSSVIAPSSAEEQVPLQPQVQENTISAPPQLELKEKLSHKPADLVNDSHSPSFKSSKLELENSEDDVES